jgi:hypothetical protein
MDNNDLIRRAKIAWHNNNTEFIALPIYSTGGVQLLDISFYKEGNEWVGRVRHEDMVEVVRIAEQLRGTEVKKPWVGLTDREVEIYSNQFNGSRLVRGIEGLLRERNT